MDHIKALRKFYDNPNAAFKSIEQAKAVAMILERKEDILAVLPTGGGKSLLFFLPAFVEKRDRKTTVVVLPLVALTKDMIDRCRKHNLTYDTWHSKL